MMFSQEQIKAAVQGHDIIEEAVSHYLRVHKDEDPKNLMDVHGGSIVGIDTGSISLKMEDWCQSCLVGTYYTEVPTEHLWLSEDDLRATFREQVWILEGKSREQATALADAQERKERAEYQRLQAMFAEEVA